MFDIGWPEILVVAIVLIIVVGPKDLPAMLRAFGRTTKKLRGMAGEFRGQFDEALREADLDEVRNTIKEARSLNPMSHIRDAVNPLKKAGEDIKAELQKSVKTDDKPIELPDPELKLATTAPKIDLPLPPDKKPEAAKSAAKGASKTAKSTGTAKKTKPSGKATPKPAVSKQVAKPAANKVAAKPAAGTAPKATGKTGAVKAGAKSSKSAPTRRKTAAKKDQA